MRRREFLAGSAALALPIRSEAIPSEWEYVWGDEFNYNGAPDTSKWAVVARESYRDRRKNVRVENNNLVLEVHKDGENYTSGGVRTGDPNTLIYQGVYGERRMFRYGRFEMRAKLSSVRGVINAFWLIGNWEDAGRDFHAVGEIDIMEALGMRPGRYYYTTHVHRWYDFPKGNRDQIHRGDYVSISGLSNKYHVFACEWDPKAIRFFSDSRLLWTRFIDETEHYRVFNKKMAMCLQCEYCRPGQWGGEEGIDDAALPASMYVDYVRVYSSKQ